MDGGQRLYLRLSVTDLCDLRCFYCMPPAGVPRLSHADVLRYEEIVRFCRLVAAHFGLAKIRLTGGEPLVRRDVVRLVEMLAGMPGRPELLLTTNGQRLAALAEALRTAGLNRVNVSLDTRRADRFLRICRGGRLEATLEGIAAAQATGLTPVRVNTVLLAGLNDDELEDMVDYGLAQGVEVRFIELMDVGAAAEWTAAHFLPVAEAIRRIGRAFAMEEEPRRPGSTARTFVVSQGTRQTRVGFIGSVSEPFCGDCNRLRLTSDGQLRWCLLQDGGLDVRGMLRSGDGEAAIVEAIAAGLAAKRRPVERRAAGFMSRIGG